VLLPAVRRAPRDELIVADGFSCREMIRQETGRNAVHLAQVLGIAIREQRRAGVDRTLQSTTGDRTTHGA
jgi:hypothetical protein